MNTISRFLLLVAIVCAGAFAGDTVAVPDRVGPLPVTAIVDGDTIHVAVTREGQTVIDTVRLLGIDAPEKGARYSKEATLWLTNLLKGEAVFLARDPRTPERDIYGRILAYVSRAPEGLDVCLEAVRQGYAVVYEKSDSSRMKELLGVMASARTAGRGLHGDAPDLLPEAVRQSSPPESPVVAPRAFTSDVTVYVTRTGRKYHVAGCRYLSKSSIPMGLKAAKAAGYTPCSVCGPPAD